MKRNPDAAFMLPIQFDEMGTEVRQKESSDDDLHGYDRIC